VGCSSRRFRQQQGFTLIELVTVVVLVSALSIFVAPRMFNTSAFNARGLQDETLALFRYAQKTAIAQRRVVCVAFTIDSASLRISALPAHSTCDTPLRGPSGEVPGTVSGKGGASYTAIPVDFNFNGLGQPVDASGAPLASQVLQISSMNSVITVEASTGYVHE
jgi:MSHA pilin protein MshC